MYTSTARRYRCSISDWIALPELYSIKTGLVLCHFIKVSKGAKIRSRYNQVIHPTQDTNGKVTNSQLDTTNKSQEVSSFSAGDHKAHINRRAQRHSKHKTEQKHKRSTKEVPPTNGQQHILLEGLNRFNGACSTTHSMLVARFSPSSVYAIGQGRVNH